MNIVGYVMLCAAIKWWNMNTKDNFYEDVGESNYILALINLRIQDGVRRVTHREEKWLELSYPQGYMICGWWEKEGKFFKAKKTGRSRNT